jgi:hypothetical protein
LSHQSRRERKAEREQSAEERQLTFRQRLGLSLSKLTQDELDAAIAKMAHDAAAGKPQAIAALARIADQAFGRAQVEAEQPATDTLERQWEQWTPAERAAYRAEIIRRSMEQQQPTGDTSDPRSDQPA